MKRLHFAVLFIALSLAGCSSLPDKPVREVMYDFGPPAAIEGAVAPAGGAPLVLAAIDVSPSLESPALLYRLGYADAHQLLPYAYARWSAPPGQLLQQRLREHLGRVRPVLDSGAAGSLARRGGATPPVLRVELEEFSHVFDTPAQSRGVLRVRCTLLETAAAGERLVAQRTFNVQRPAPTPDAAGGVRALSIASDAVALEIAAWMAQQR